jgi:2-polyprenyl-3-methyl-5-hydroxy-6-metoxy-1,4-benzoquinol methylase
MRHEQHAEHGAEHGDTEYTQEFWDDRYGSADRIWSGQPNVQLVAQVAGLPPGEALDVGCGEGADAIWLAARGWHVTAVDVSGVALDRGARLAAAAGDQVATRITWQQRDMLVWDPGPARYDLVSAQFMHLPRPAQDSMHTRLAAAVRPGGTLLIVGHLHDELHAHIAPRFRPAEEIAAELDPAAWQVILATAIERTGTGPDGEPVVLSDSVLRAVRRPEAG